MLTTIETDLEANVLSMKTSAISSERSCNVFNRVYIVKRASVLE